MSLFDRMKDKVSAAGKGAQQLTKIGKLKLDLKAAESELSDRFKALGKACANRIIERGESSVDATESAIATYIRQILEGRERIRDLEAELEDVRSQ